MFCECFFFLFSDIFIIFAKNQTIYTMRKLLLLAICIPFLSYAQSNYHPMVVEGKVWNMIQTNYDWSMEGGNQTTYVPFTYELRGDTIVGDMPGLKLYRCFSDYENYYGMMSETDKKVYMVKAGTTEPTLLYDFSLQVGDSIAYNDITAFVNPVYKKLMMRDSLQFDGEYYRRFMFKSRWEMDEYFLSHYTDWEKDYWELYEYIWIEGVGSGDGPVFTFRNHAYVMTGKSSWETLNSCNENGHEITYSKYGYNPKTSGIHPIKSTACPNSPIYDLSGRRADGKKPGVYIKDGKKFVIK